MKCLSRSWAASRSTPATAVCVLLGLAAGAAWGSERGTAASYVRSDVHLVASDGSPTAQFGYAVSMAADANTVLVGAPRDLGGGAARVFTRTGSTWSQMGPTLTGAGVSPEGAEEGAEEGADDHFGASVALSVDGNTALVGSPGDERGRGAVWVFARSGATWSLQGELAGAEEAGDARFGRSVAVSADGGTVLVGGSADGSGRGAIWVFTRTGPTWSQQGPKLTDVEASPSAYLGRSVALSADGDTALAGGPGDSAYVGAAWVFARSGSVWTEQGSKLTGGQEGGAGHFGRSVALSSTGDTALIGGRRDENGVGAAWVFTRADAGWTQQSAKLIGIGEEGNGEFGTSVALSADGNTALVGAPTSAGRRGGARMFTRNDASWAQLGEPLEDAAETGSGWFGYSVALSGDGSAALVGSPMEWKKAGTAGILMDSPLQEAGQAGESETPSEHVGQRGCEAGPAPAGTLCSTGRLSGSGCTVTLVSRRISVQGGRRATVRLTVKGEKSCRARLVLVRRRRDRHRRVRTTALAATDYTFTSGGPAAIPLAFNGAGRSLFKAGRGRMVATLVISSGRSRLSASTVLTAVRGRRATVRKH